MSYIKEKHDILLEKAILYGYKAIEPYTVKNHEGVDGLLVEYHDKDVDNGTYYLQIQENGAVVLRVEQPNTIANFEKTNNVLNAIKDTLNNSDVKKLNPYDFVTIFSELINTYMLHPLSTTLFPEDLKKQFIFKEKFMGIFLEDILNYHIADDSKKINEVTINGKPYWFKQIIDEKYEEIIKQLENEYEKRIDNNK